MAKAKFTASCSHAEYESLPEPLKRKYFSSVERLRIEVQEEQRQHQDSRESSRANSHRSLPLTLRARRRLRKAASPVHNHHAAQADAQFFLSLPEKVQRCAFSREEQILLAGHYTSTSPPSRHDPEPTPFSDFQFDFAPVRGRSLRRPSSAVATAASPSLSPFSSVRASIYHLSQQSQDTQSSLLYLDTMSSASYIPPSSNSSRRARSLTHVPPPVRNSFSENLPLPRSRSSTRANLSWHQRSHSHSISISGRRSSHQAVAPVFDSEAAHYRDPEARKKLRTYFTSPQKFDEAVEFGFAPTNDQDSKQSHYQLPPIATDARNFSRDMQTFLKNDTVSFLEDLDDDDDDNGMSSDHDSIADIESPITPSSGLSFRCHTRQQSSNFSSIDSNGLPPHHPLSSRFNREMTLRMTLTRPDLRADEEQLYGWQSNRSIKDDPFALEELQLTDDMNGTQGPFYVKPKSHGNLVSRLFKRASRKGR
ncbi:hypothetical protein DM02DRAFT_42817 [Periconia macrospinosa]|uniref:Uncharacterized protein n=1 Tax=Periconia macrospinosa TaxID=97972 RepID=A0A2V1DMU8_9PLEO|nr:hypothetical protein DM02DRAFT_42817 [Periconia macrospinosa]